MRARISSGEEGVLQSVELLRGGGVVGVPTETVYGLAGMAFNPMAVARIFEVKGRPLSDPLIVHLPEAGWIERIVRFSSREQRDLVQRLGDAYWPGPLTLLLPRHPELPDLVTAGSDLVAVRVTAHPLLQDVMRRLGSPLAAPSANRFGRISPTSARDVLEELGEHLELILDGGPCLHGLESTIVSVQNGSLTILRPGPIGHDHLARFGPPVVAGNRQGTPGSLPGHYAPGKSLRIAGSDFDRSEIPEHSGYLAFTPPPDSLRNRFCAVEVLSASGDLKEAAVHFYAALRRLDEGPAETLFASPLPEEGIGIAIMDRLRRASHGSLREHESAA